MADTDTIWIYYAAWFVCAVKSPERKLEQELHTQQMMRNTITTAEPSVCLIPNNTLNQQTAGERPDRRTAEKTTPGSHRCDPPAQLVRSAAHCFLISSGRDQTRRRETEREPERQTDRECAVTITAPNNSLCITSGDERKDMWWKTLQSIQLTTHRKTRFNCIVFYIQLISIRMTWMWPEKFVWVNFV